METMTTNNETTMSDEVTKNNERRHAMRLEANARLASLAFATRQATQALGAARNAACGDSEGAERKALAKAWTACQREAVHNALNASTVTVTLQRTGKRFLATGFSDVTDPETGTVTMRLSGDVSVVDSLGEVPTGCTVTVRLSRRDSRPDKRGKVATTFTVSSVGVASNGQRVALRGRLVASRFVRVIASAL